MNQLARQRSRILAGLTVGLLGVGGCTADGGSAARPTVETSSPSSPGCPDVTGNAIAANGAISAGPFSAEALAARSSDSDPSRCGWAPGRPTPRTSHSPSTPRTARRLGSTAVPGPPRRRTTGCSSRAWSRSPPAAPGGFRIPHGADEFCFTVDYPPVTGRVPATSREATT